MVESIPGITIRPYRAGDEAGILKSFNLVFREVCGEGYVDRQRDFWEWEYLGNPAGYRIWVAEADNGDIAGHYAGVPYRLSTAHGELCFVHAVDSFTHPDYRRGLQRPGLFVHTARPWFDACAAAGDALVYGYPVKNAWRIGERFVGYTKVRIIDYLCLELGAAKFSAVAAIDTSRVTSPSADVDQLFAAVAAENTCLVQRTAEYFAWRYAAMPGGCYEIIEARCGGALRGLAVLRPQHELVPGGCAIADWLVPAGDDEARDALLAHAAARAGEAGRERLVAVFACSSRETEAFRRSGFELVPSDRYMERCLGHNSFHPEMTTEWLRQHWWYTLGDSDLV